MKKFLLILAILTTIVFVHATYTEAADQATANARIKAKVTQRYQISFTEAVATPDLTSDTDVGDVTITCNAKTFFMKMHCGDSNYISGTTAYLKTTDAADVTNDFERVLFKVWFEHNSGTLYHSAETAFPETSGESVTITNNKADRSYEFTRTPGGVTRGYVWDFKIMPDASEDLATKVGGDYDCNIIITLADS